MRNHGGFIRTESKLGKGTQFRVYLPARPAEVAAPEVPAMAPPRGQGELILVVDDEESIRMMTRRVLEQFGYRVLLAGEGTEAVMVFAQHAAEINLVLTDLVMPLMDGVTLIRTLQRMAPAVKVLTATGATELGQLAAARRLGVKAVLRKPYTQDSLLQGVRATLDGRGFPAATASGSPFFAETKAPFFPPPVA